MIINLHTKDIKLFNLSSTESKACFDFRVDPGTYCQAIMIDDQFHLIGDTWTDPPFSTKYGHVKWNFDQEKFVIVDKHSEISPRFRNHDLVYIRSKHVI